MDLQVALHDAKPRVLEVKMESAGGSLSEIELKLVCGRVEAERIVHLAHTDNVAINAQNDTESE